MVYRIELDVNVDVLSLFGSLRNKFGDAFLLESTKGPERFMDMSIIGFGAGEYIKTNDSEILMKKLKENEYISRERYLGGLVGFVSYNASEIFDNAVHNKKDNFPPFYFGLFYDGIIYNHRSRKYTYFTHGDVRINDDNIKEILKYNSKSEKNDFSVEKMQNDMTREEYMNAVKSAKEAILNGEIFQVVLSRKLEGRYTGDIFEVYCALRNINPSPYMYFLDFPDYKVVGTSPEMLVRTEGRMVTTYPIAGTRPAGKTQAESENYREELLSSEKEMAEHRMLVDLARNDIGRISIPGTVNVSEYMEIEKFSHVQHMVSRVDGTIRENKSSIDVLSSVFPAGTVSGAPKIRAMEIIAELEKSPRGIYSGSVGYISFTGNMDMAIAIRSVFAQNNIMEIRAGAGIVHDSDPYMEYMETEAKLGAMYGAINTACKNGSEK